jgi:capsid assembly protease
MSLLVRIADRLIGRPLLVTPDKAEIILDVLAGRIGLDAYPDNFGGVLRTLKADVEGIEPFSIDGKIGVLEPEANRFGAGSQRRDDGSHRLTRAKNGVASITIDGSLVNRGAWIGANSGLVSYEGIGAQLADAVADNSITSIVLDINSPGGEAGGMFGLAKAVRDAAAIKTVIAVVNDMAASAAYGIASGASEIIVSETSMVGSIGVVLLHLDRTVEMEKKGIRPTLIHAGAHKVDGNPFAPLPAGVRAHMQAEVDKIYSLFVSAVAAGRGSRLDDAAARKTEARVFLGAEAVALGLADRVGSYEAVMASLTRTRSAHSSGAHSMSTNQSPAAVAEGVAPAPVVTAPASAPAQAAAPSGDAVKARIRSIQTCEAAAGRADLANHLAFDTDLSVEQATAILDKAPKEAAAQAPGPAGYLAAKTEDGAFGLGNPASQTKEANHGWSRIISAEKELQNLG